MNCHPERSEGSAFRLELPPSNVNPRYDKNIMNWRERITVNPAVCHGRACIRGTRIMVSAIVDNVAAGLPRQDILRSYPALTDSDIDAALAYAAELAREGTVDLPTETPA